MKPYLLVLAFVAAPLFAATTAAAPIPADSKNAGPAIIVQMKSFDQLLDVAKTSAKKFLAAPIYKEFETQVIKGLDPNFLAGIDTKRPAAFYTTIGEGLMTGDFSKSSAVALVPITNEKEFIATLVRLGFKPEQKGDIWTLPVPNSPIDSTLQFKKNYAYISLSTVKLDVKSLLDPAEVVNDKETAAFVVRLLIDRVPDELKKGGLEFLAQAAGMTKALEMPPEERDLLDDATRTGLRWLKTGIRPRRNSHSGSTLMTRPVPLPLKQRWSRRAAHRSPNRSPRLSRPRTISLASSAPTQLLTFCCKPRCSWKTFNDCSILSST